MLPDISAADFASMILDKPRRKLKESSLLNSFLLTDRDKDVEANLYRLVTEQKDRTHTFMLNIVEVWIGDQDFTLKQYTGRTSGKTFSPLAITYSSSGETESRVAWDDKSSRHFDLVGDTKYEPILVAEIPVGREFSVHLAAKDTHSFCNDNRPYDFFTFTAGAKYELLEGLNFLFFVHKTIAKHFEAIPIHVVELQERTMKGRKMYLPAYLTDFMVDDLRADYGDAAMDRFFAGSIAKLKQAFPHEPLLNSLRPQDFEGYRITFSSLDRLYAISFKC